MDLSLVVPVHHCAGRLDASLEKLCRFLDDAPAACKLILVDDRGTDASAADAAALAPGAEVSIFQA